MRNKFVLILTAVLTILALTAPVMAQSGGFTVIAKSQGPVLGIGDALTCRVVALKTNNNVKMICEMTGAPLPTIAVVPSPTARPTNTVQPTATRQPTATVTTAATATIAPPTATRTPRPTRTSRPAATEWPTATATEFGYPVPPTDDWNPYPTP